jgi:transcription elongation GreA/GreB family factor
MQHIKQQLYLTCQEYLQMRIDAAQQAINAAQQSANDETKSSSGDKYETGRAMMQLEVEKHASQLAAAMKLRHTLNQIRIDNACETVQAGSLVVTDREVFFMAISLGKVDIEEKSYLVISPASPLGQNLMGLKSGDRTMFHGQPYIIQEII